MNEKRVITPDDPHWVEFTPKPDDFVPNRDWPKDHAHYRTNVPRCQSWSPRKGRQCLGIAMTQKGLDVCSAHGGKTLSGIAHPNATNLRYSKTIPRNLKERYEQLMNDEELLAMRDEIAVITSYISEQLGDIDTDAVSPEAWMEAQAEFNRLLDALNTGNMSGMNTSIFKLGKILEGGSETVKKWNNVITLMDNRRRMIQAEEKRLIDGSMLISVETIMRRLDILLDCIRENVTDKKALQAIQTQYRQLTGG